MASPDPEELLRAAYFRLSKEYYQATQNGTAPENLVMLKQEMDTIIQQMKLLDGRDPASLMLE